MRASRWIFAALLAAVCLTTPALADDTWYSELTLKYIGNVEDAEVTVEQTVQGGPNATTTFDDINFGDELTVLGQDADGTLGPTLRIDVDGKHNTTIRTNCSVELVPGYTRKDFEVTNAVGACGDGEEEPDCEADPDAEGCEEPDCEADPDAEGCEEEPDCEADPDAEGCEEEPDCEADPDAEGCEEPDCDECDGKVTELTLRYNGKDEDDEEPIDLRVTQRVRSDLKVLIFKTDVDEPMYPGDLFTITGVDRKGTLGPKIRLVVDGHVRARIHTSCSEDIGPGLKEGRFEVVEGYSRNGGLLCPVPDDDDDDGEPNCDECDGQVTDLALRYLGDSKVHVEVTQKIQGVWITIFDELVGPGEEPDDPGEPFEVVGANPKGTLGPRIRIYVEGELHEVIHTSCSEPIGAGLVAGDFEVIGGSSRNGGLLCPLPADDGGEEPDDGGGG